MFYNEGYLAMVFVQFVPCPFEYKTLFYSVHVYMDTYICCYNCTYVLICTQESLSKKKRK